MSTSSSRQASCVGKPLLAHANWSLPRIDCHKRIPERTGPARPQHEHSRPIPSERQVRDPLDSWSPDPCGRGPAAHLIGPYLSFSPPNEPCNRPDVPFCDRSSPVILLQDLTNRSRDPRDWFASESRAPAAAPAAQPHVRPPSIVNAHRYIRYHIR